ncbi:MAG: hypothetical protein WC959_03105 [Kiritimatiellales bacterium]
MRKMTGGYNYGIRYADEHAGKILAALEEQGVVENKPCTDSGCLR